MNINLTKSKRLKGQLYKKFKCVVLPNLADCLYEHCKYQPNLIEQLIDSKFKREALMQYLAKRISRDSQPLINNPNLKIYVRDYLKERKLITSEYWKNYHNYINERRKYYDNLINNMSIKEINKILASNNPEDLELRNELVVREYHLYSDDD